MSKRGRPSPEQWQRIETIFDAAVDVTPDERMAFLDRECGGDALLRREVAELLAADESAPAFLETALVASLADFVEKPSVAGQIVSGYRLIDELGRGGMSIVYRAERADGRFDKQVAVKVVGGIAGQDSETARRFRVESRILATLEHPHIARVLDAGVTEHGDPYLVMEFVDGRPITQYCIEEHLNLAARLALFKQVCEAVHHAHQRLIVHRDLKPSNILVARPDAGDKGPGYVKLLDFGIAKLLDDSSAEKTRTGLFLMTPQYAAPEQVRGELITTATDVYALGLLLYQMLVGKPPYEVAGRTPQEILHTVCEAVPIRPSTRATEAAVAKQARETPAGLSSMLRGDLDAIVLKALDKEPERRYASALALSQDLERYAKGLPVEAKPASRVYLAAKFIRRNRLAVGVVSLVLVLAVGAALRERLNSERIVQERDRADQLVTFLVDIFGDADPAETRGREVTARELLARGAERVGKDLDGKAREQARLWSTIGSIYTNLGLLDDALPLQRRAVATGAAALGSDDPDVLNARAHLAEVLKRLGDYEAAETEIRAVVENRSRTLGADHQLTLDAASDLATILEAQGKFEEAERLLGRAVQGLLRQLGPDHDMTLGARYAMANVLYSAGDWERAEAQYRLVLEGRRRTVGPDHPMALSALNDLSLLLSDMGRLDEAVAQYLDLLVMSERVFGADHPEFLTHKNNLAIAYYQQGRFEDAAAIMAEVHDTTIRRFGTDHPDALNTLNNLAMLQQKLGRYDRSFDMLTQARDGYARTLGEEHPQTLTMIQNLGATEVLRGRFSEARALFQQAFEARTRILGAAHPHTLLTQIQLGRSYTALGQPGAACELLADAVALSGETYPDGHPTIGRARLHYGECLAATGRLEIAEKELLGAYKILSEASVAAKQDAALELGKFYAATGRRDEAARYQAVAEHASEAEQPAQ